jgi:hypothetical protein
MDLADIRLEVRDILGEDSADFWKDAELNRYINEALRRFTGANRWSWLLTEGTAQLDAEDPDLLLTDGVADYHHLHMMLTRNGDTRPYLPERVSPARGFQLRTAFYTSQSYPRWWYVTGVADDDGDGEFQTTVKFIPTPTGVIDVEFQYYRNPATLDGDADVPDIPEDFHKALVHYAAGTAWLKELTGTMKAKEQFDLYTAMVAEAVDDEESQSDDDILVVGGEQDVGARQRFTGPMSAQDYVLQRIAPTLGP